MPVHQYALRVALSCSLLAGATSMDHGYMVDMAHLLFTASVDSHDTQRYPGTGEQWKLPGNEGGETIVDARTYAGS